jgi:hypothetical protein
VKTVLKTMSVISFWNLQAALYRLHGPVPPPRSPAAPSDKFFPKKFDKPRTVTGVFVLWCLLTSLGVIDSCMLEARSEFPSFFKTDQYSIVYTPHCLHLRALYPGI